MADQHDDSRGEARQSFFAKQQLINSARTTFQLLSAVVKNASLYPEAHPSLLSSAEKLLGKIQELLMSRKEVAFYLVRGELFFETLSVPVDENLALLMEQFTSRDAGGVIFKPGLTQQEIIRFAGLINKESSSLTAEGGIHEIIKKANISHIGIHRVLLVDKKAGDAIKEGKKKSKELFMGAVGTVKELLQDVHLNKAASMRKMNTIVQTMVDTVLENRDALIGLTNLKMYDEYTFAHSVNTSILSTALGTFLAFEKPQIAALGMAALLHDIGKVAVPHEIINKPGQLTDDEWEAVKRHPIEGALLLSDIPAMTKLAMVAAFEHHLHGGEGGYPKVGRIHQQHLFSQIVSLADAYEALTAARVYYSAQMPPDNAVRILIKKRGSKFHPVLVKAFVNMIGIFPIGTLLKLNTGEIGLVTHQTRDLMRPRVLLLDKLDGSEKESGADVSLVETFGGKYIRTAVGTINPYSAKIDIKKYLE